MARGTCEIHWTGTAKEQCLPECQRLFLFRVTKCCGEGTAVGTISDIGCNCAKILDRRASTGVRTGEQLHPVEALQLFHAPQYARLDIHDAVSIGKIPRERGKCPVDFAGS